jgi:hypothetical protein
MKNSQPLPEMAGHSLEGVLDQGLARCFFRDVEQLKPQHTAPGSLKYALIYFIE